MDICRCVKNGKFRKSNSIHVINKYSQSPESKDKRDHLELAASIPELVHISKDSDDPELDDITETNMVTIKNVNQTLSSTPASIKYTHPNHID